MCWDGHKFHKLYLNCCFPYPFVFEEILYCQLTPLRNLRAPLSGSRSRLPVPMRRTPLQRMP
jgi:hypothetical protein